LDDAPLGNLDVSGLVFVLGMTHRLLVLSRYSRMGASSRLRTFQYRPWLENAGFDVEYASFFDDAYLERLYSGRTSKAELLRYYGTRVAQLRCRPEPNLAWIEKEALPWLPWIIERACLPTSIPIVSDYDDAVFHRYDQHRLVPVRWLLGRKIDRVMQRSELVTAGNSYLADRARRAGAPRVEVVPTVVDLSLYQVRSASAENSPVRVGWIGTPNTWEAFGKSLFAQLDETLALHGARFRAVGAKLVAETTGLLDIVPWSEETEVSAIQDMDIGVMPLPDTPWTRGKCGYKLIQYMACGLPVVASPVGVNKDIVEHGVNGFLAETDAEWREAIETLLSDADLRRRMGAAGRKKVEDGYSLQVWGPRMAQMLRRVADEGRSG
jgi:glycosyltransferase involved in cell wall biosynthesis